MMASRMNDGVRLILDERIKEVNAACVSERRKLAAHHARCFVDEQLYPLLDRLVNGWQLDRHAAARMCLGFGVSAAIARLEAALLAYGKSDLTSRYNRWRESYIATMQGLKPMGFNLAACRTVAKSIAPAMLAEIFDLIWPIANSNGSRPVNQEECIGYFDKLGVGTSYGWNER